MWRFFFLHKEIILVTQSTWKVVFKDTNHICLMCKYVFSFGFFVAVMSHSYLLSSSVHTYADIVKPWGLTKHVQLVPVVHWAQTDAEISQIELIDSTEVLSRLRQWSDALCSEVREGNADPLIRVDSFQSYTFSRHESERVCQSFIEVQLGTLTTDGEVMEWRKQTGPDEISWTGLSRRWLWGEEKEWQRNFYTD